MNEQEFKKYIEKLYDIKLTKIQLEQFSRYYQLLIEENKKINLTSIIEKSQVYLKHFLDSAMMIKGLEKKENITLCDIGTGAGFPGIVIKILYPKIKITLIDSLEKRINFLNKVIKELKLNSIEAIHSRIEDYSKNNPEKYDVITSRAVAKLNILLELSSKMLKINGLFIAMKSSYKEELQQSINAINELNLSLKEIIEYKLPIENSKRTLIKITKKMSTPPLYPRNFNKIKKKPL